MLVLRGRRAGNDLMAFAPDGRTLAARSETGLQLWRDISPNAKPVVFRELDSVGHLQFSPDGRTLYLDGYGSGRLDVASGKYEEFADYDGYRYLALSADGETVVAVHLPPSRENEITCWPVATPFAGDPLWRVPLAASFGGRPLSLPDGSFLVDERTGPATTGEFRFRARSGASGDGLRSSDPLTLAPERVVVSPCGRWVAGQHENRIAVWSLPELKPSAEWRNDSRKIFTDLAFHPSGEFLAVTANDATVRFHDSARLGVSRTFTWDVGRMKGVAFSPDGSLVAAGSDTGRVVVWDVDG